MDNLVAALTYFINHRHMMDYASDSEHFYALYKINHIQQKRKLFFSLFLLENNLFLSILLSLFMKKQLSRLIINP